MLARIFIFLSMGLLALPWACQTNYSLQPLSGPTATPTYSGPTPTPTCYYPDQNLNCSNGIMWNGGELTALGNSGVTDVYAQLYLAVNCAPYSTATVNITGPGGFTIPLTYSGTFVLNGTTYANYDYPTNSTTLLQVGVYTLTAITSSGTASASVSLPAYPTIASDGSTASWSSNNTFNLTAVENSSNQITYESSACWSASSPFTFPSSAYPSHGTYSVAVESFNYTTNITGGSGYFETMNIYGTTVTK